MEILLALLGALIGGTIGHFGGAVAGALVGWLWGRVSELSTEQQGFRKELERLRRRLGDPMPLHPAPEPTPAGGLNLPQPDTLELSLRDLVFEPAGPTKPVSEQARPVSRPQGPKPEPIEPEVSSPFATWLGNLVSGENLLVKVGVIILFFGVSFLVKYAAQHGLFPLELRLTAAALGGCALLAIGWRLHHERPVYAQVIQGGGIGILYLTAYAAMRLYHLLPLSFGFGLLVAICALAGFLAVAQESRTLAVMGSIGGFLAPELASIGSGSHLVLFSYYAVLNAGVLGIACYRAWRELNLVGFAGTFIVGALWGSRFYRPELFPTVEPFLILFFLIYAALPLLYARKNPSATDGQSDIALIFATPLLAVAFQQPLVERFEYGLAWSAMVLGFFYLTLAGCLLRSAEKQLRKLAEAFLPLGALFATLAIPLAFDGRWTAAVWSVEGTAMVWAGLRQKRLLARLFGYLLLLGSGIAFITDLGMKTGSWPVLNSFYVGCLLISGAALASAWLLQQTRLVLPEPELPLEKILFAWGVLWWFAAGLHEIDLHTVSSQLTGVRLAFFALSCLGCAWLRRRLDWQLFAVPALVLLPVMAVIALLQLLDGSRYPSLHGGWFGWPTAFIAWYLILHDSEKHESGLHSVVHAAPLWLATLLAAWEVSGQLQRLPGMATWAICALGSIPALAVLLLVRHSARLPWPVAGNRQSYLGQGCMPLAAASWIWLIYVNLTQAGNPWPLPYLPFLNPLDGASILVLLSLAAWYRDLPNSLLQLAAEFPHKEARIAFGGTLFIWLNAVLLRTIHHWCDVPFTADALFASLLVQTTLSICWSLAALAIMTLATGRGSRPLWLGGATLLGTVVVKLFLVDLAGHGSVARIVSFVGVGLLLLVIGWFSPVPPRGTEKSQ